VKAPAITLITGSHNIDIGNLGVANESNTIRIGAPDTHTATFVAGISGATVAGGVAVYVNPSGQLGTLTSSSRFKKDLVDMSTSSEAILSLRPVKFRYKPDVASDTIPQFGLIAEEVERVCPDLVARDAKGDPYSVRYEAVNAMLLNEFLKDHKRVREQACENENQNVKIDEQARKLSEQQQEIKALREQLAEMRRLVERMRCDPAWCNAVPRVESNHVLPALDEDRASTGLRDRFKSLRRLLAEA